MAKTRRETRLTIFSRIAEADLSQTGDFRKRITVAVNRLLPTSMSGHGRLPLGSQMAPSLWRGLFVQPRVCEPFGAWHPSGPGLRDTELNLKRKAGFNPSATPLRKERRICICLGLLGNICRCPCWLGTFWVSPGAGAVLGGHALRVRV